MRAEGAVWLRELLLLLWLLLLLQELLLLLKAEQKLLLLLELLLLELLQSVWWKLAGLLLVLVLLRQLRVDARALWKVAGELRRGIKGPLLGGELELGVVEAAGDGGRVDGTKGGGGVGDVGVEAPAGGVWLGKEEALRVE